MAVTISNLQYIDAQSQQILMVVTGWQSFPPINFVYNPAHTDELTLEVKAILTGANPPAIAAFVQLTPAPLSVSPRQIRLALTQLGLRAQVEAFVAAADQTTKDNWDYASEFVFDNPLVDTCMTALGKTDADKLALFQLAGTL